MKPCHACGQTLARADFSGSMWKRAAPRRCKTCVSENRPAKRPDQPAASELDGGNVLTNQPAAGDVAGFFSSSLSTSEAVKAKLSSLASLSPEELKHVLEHSARSQIRNIATAAGVVWGAEEMPARMKEMQFRHDTMLDLSDKGGLTFHMIKEYHDWIAELSAAIASEGEAMMRSYRLAMAKQSRTHDPTRQRVFLAQADAIRANERRYNNEVTMAKHETAWLLDSPAWKKALEFLKEHWVQTSKGDWVSKKDLEDDMSTSFDDLLASMKEEDGMHEPARCDREADHTRPRPLLSICTIVALVHPLLFHPSLL